MIFFLLSNRGNRVTFDLKNPGVEIHLPQQYVPGEERPGSLLVVDSYDRFLSIEKSDRCAYVVLGSPQNGEANFNGLSVAYIETDKNTGQVFNEIIGIHCALIEWGYRLKTALHASKPIQEVFAVGRSIYPREFCLADNYSSVIAYTPGSRVFKRPEFADFDEAMFDEEFINAEKFTDIFLFPEHTAPERLLCMNIHTENDFQLRVLAEVGDCEVSEGEKQLFRIICDHIKMAYYHKNNEDRIHRRQNDPLHKALRKLLCDKNSADKDEIWETLSNYGWKRDQQYLLALIELGHHQDLELLPIFLCNKLEFELRESCALKTDRGIVWIFNKSLSSRNKRSISDVYQALACFLRDTVTKAGVSEFFEDLSSIQEYLFQAETALRLGKMAKPEFWYYKFEDYIIDYFLESATRNVSKENLYYKGLKKLEEYDLENGTDLLSTFKHYAECMFNTGTAAEQIYVHRSTLIRRIEKIKAICGFDLTNIDEVIHILLSIRLMKSAESRPLLSQHDQSFKFKTA